MATGVHSRGMTVLPIVVRQWRVCQGLGFGYAQPIVIGSLHVEDLPENPGTASFEALAELGKHMEVDVSPLASSDRASEMGGIVAALSLAVQQRARIAVFQPTRIIAARAETADAGFQGTLIAPYANAQATIDSLVFACKALSTILHAGNPEEASGALKQAVSEADAFVRKYREAGEAGVTTERILSAAVKARIPFARLVGNAYVFGQGHRSRWLMGTFTDRTPQIAAQIARNKAATSSLLAANGLPVARNMAVASVDAAIRAAKTLGYPVVVKPIDQDNGVGVHAGLLRDEQVARCARDALEHSRQVLVEVFQPGRDYRLSVQDGRLIKTIERLAGAIVGNGTDSIRELLAQQREDPTAKRRSRERGKSGLELDAEALELLAEAGRTPDNIPAAGERIVLRRRSNVSTGGTTCLVGHVHPDNRKLAEDAALALRLDVAGVDLILPDIEVSWRTSGGIVCEVNAQPQLGERDTPGLYAQFLTSLLEGDGRIPCTLIVATDPSRERREEWLRAIQSDASVALVEGGDVRIDGEAHADFGDDIVAATRAALLSQRVRAVVVIASPARLLQSGLPADRFDSVLMDSWAVQDGREPTAADAAYLFHMLGPHVSGQWTFRGDGVFGKAVAAHAGQASATLADETAKANA